MPAPSSAKPLYRIDECPDLMADGCVGDEQGNLVFLSIWARDTAVQEFLARLTLGRDEQGLGGDRAAVEGAFELFVKDAFVRRVHVDHDQTVGDLTQNINAMQLAEREAQRRQAVVGRQGFRPAAG